VDHSAGNRPTVVINLLSSFSGGAITYANRAVPLIARKLEERGYTVWIVAHEDCRQKFHLLDGPEVIWLRHYRPANLLRYLFDALPLRKLLRERGACLVYNPYQMGPRYRGLANCFMLRNVEVFHYRSYPGTFAKSLRNQLLFQFSARALRRATCSISVSAEAKRLALRQMGLEDGKLEVIPHGIDPPVACERAMPQADASFCLSVGSIIPYRCTEVLLKAFSLSRTERRLLIAGPVLSPVYHRELQELVTQLGLQDRVEFLGKVSPDRLQELYYACHLCVFTSEVEACPNTLLEAAQSCRRLVCVDLPPMNEMVRAIPFYPPGDAAALAGLLEELDGTDDGGAEPLFADRFVQRQSWESCADATADFLAVQAVRQ
jgi:glycosyltransferase involved in cell wall biosynthesis